MGKFKKKRTPWLDEYDQEILFAYGIGLLLLILGTLANNWTPTF